MVNWIDNFVRPKISDLWRKRDMPEDRWVKCPESGQMVFYKDLEDNQFVIPGSDYHMRMSAEQRLGGLFDDANFQKLDLPSVPLDPLKFRDEKRYTDRLKAARESTTMDDAVMVGAGTLDGLPVVAAVQDFKFMGGSLGMAAGEAVVTGMLRAVEDKAPFVMFAASGGARMQEGMLSLMQMPRTTIAVQALRAARLPYVVVMTHPTTGGVTASYAMLGDVHIAEPGALIGFAGPRVIEQTIRQQLPDGFQRAEYLLEHGMLDMVVHRHELRATLSDVCHVLSKADPRVVSAKAAETHDGVTITDEQRLLEAPTSETDATPDPATEHAPEPLANGKDHQAESTAKSSADKSTTAKKSKANGKSAKNGKVNGNGADPAGKNAAHDDSGTATPEVGKVTNGKAAKDGDAGSAPQG